MTGSDRTVTGTNTSFGPIPPSPARDFFVFDYTSDIAVTGDPTAQIDSVTWTCTVDDTSPVSDPDPTSRIVQPPTYTKYQTSALCGDMLDGVIYLLESVATISDGRVFIKDGEVLCSGLPPLLRPPVVVNCVIQFDYGEFVAKFPELSELDPDLAQEYWNEAGMLFRNDCTSPEQDPVIRREILDLLTAHCAMIFGPPPIGKGGGGSSALTGVLTNKSVNGVSIGSSGLFPGVSGTQAWLLTTQYGAKAWRLMAAYRAFHYVQGPQRYPYPPNRTWPPSYGYYFPWPWGP